MELSIDSRTKFKQLIKRQLKDWMRTMSKAVLKTLCDDVIESFGDLMPDDFEENINSPEVQEALENAVEAAKSMMEQNLIRMMKLFLQQPDDTKRQRSLLKNFLAPATSHFLLKNFTEFFGINANPKTIGEAFCTLLDNDCYKGQSAIDLLRLMLDYGLPVNEFMYNDLGHRYIVSKGLTPLQLSIKKNRVDIVSVLLEHGADVNLKTNGFFTRSSLWLAVEYCDESMVNLLLQNGAKPNDNIVVPCVLKKAIHLNKPEVVYSLLKYGADLDISSDEEWSLLMENKRLIFARELAKLVFEGHIVCSKNLGYLKNKHNKRLHDSFKNCIKELR